MNVIVVGNLCGVMVAGPGLLAGLPLEQVSGQAASTFLFLGVNGSDRICSRPWHSGRFKTKDGRHISFNS